MTGAPEVVLVRSKVIVESYDRFVKRARFGEQLTAAAGAAA